MSHILDIDIKHCLSLPIPYLLQEFTKKVMLQKKDANGWGIMHWAVATGNVQKVKELIEADFDFSIKSFNNEFPKDFFEFSVGGSIVKLNNDFLSFSRGGITPAHLSIFLYSQYDMSSFGKGQMTFQTLKQNQDEIISLFNNDILSFTDLSGFSVVDYAFMMQNIECIEKIMKIDAVFDGLKKIKIETAKNIIEGFKKHQIKTDLFFENKINDILNVLQKKADFVKLKESLPKK